MEPDRARIEQAWLAEQERRRIQLVVAREGLEGAREWATRILAVYRRAIDSPGHPSTPQYRPMFEASIHELERWLAETEIKNS